MSTEQNDKKSKSDKKVKKEKSKKDSKKSEPASATTGPHATPLAVIEENWEQNRTLIENICKTPPNNMCNDCNQPGTRWASVNHGVFVCIRCSGIHRSMGVHISKVKSTNMDKWTSSEVKLAEAIGNKRAKELFEGRLPKNFKPLCGNEPEAALKNFIQKKYEEKVFSTEGIAEILKKMHKQTGYGKKGGAAMGSLQSPLKPSAQHEDPMTALYGANSGLDKKKKAKPVEGAFGFVNVPAEEHDRRRGVLLEQFGVVAAVGAAATDEGNAPPSVAAS